MATMLSAAMMLDWLGDKHQDAVCARVAVELEQAVAQVLQDGDVRTPDIGGSSSTSEENTQTTEQQQAMINYIADLDAYGHNIVVHTFPGDQDKVYRPLLGDKSKLTGVSLQNSSLETTHEQTVKWVRESAQAGKPWIVAFDESGSAAHAQCPDLSYNGFDGHDRSGKMVYTQHKVRKQTLWGKLMAGGAGCEYYFGYQFDEQPLLVVNVFAGACGYGLNDPMARWLRPGGSAGTLVDRADSLVRSDYATQTRNGSCSTAWLSLPRKGCLCIASFCCCWQIFRLA